MLEQKDIDRVSAYIYEGFPELKGAFNASRARPLQTENLDDNAMMDFWVGTHSYKVPEGFARISNMFMLARTFVQASQPEQTHQTETLCDAVAAACVLTVEGAAAHYPMSFIRDGRLSSEDPLHDSGILLLHMLGNRAFPGEMNAKQALEHAQELYNRYYPAENTVKAHQSEPVPAL